MFIKYLPALMMLVSGIIALITSMVNRLELLTSMEILLVVMIVFFVLGKIAQKIIVKMIITNREIEKAKKEQEQKERLEKIENKVFNKEYGLNKIFYNGQFYDAYTLIQSIFESAKNEIIIIDSYVDRTILDRLVVKKKSVKVVIYTSITTSKILGKDITTFNKQYGNLDVRYTNKVHDRYIVIDKVKLYHLGASIKDLGRKIFSISESDSNLISELLRCL